MAAVLGKLDSFPLGAQSSVRGTGFGLGLGSVLEVGVGGGGVAAGWEGLDCMDDMAVADFWVVDGFDVRCLRGSILTENNHRSVVDEVDAPSRTEAGFLLG